jgi:hypothetical protein
LHVAREGFFSIRIFYAPLSRALASYPVYRSLPDFTILTASGDLYKTRSFSLCNILNCSLTSFFLGLHIYSKHF